jgi:hypothetical protein
MYRILPLGMMPFSWAKRAIGALKDAKSNNGSATEQPRNGSFISLSPEAEHVNRA